MRSICMQLNLQDEKAAGVHNLQGAKIAVKSKKRIIFQLRRKMLAVEFNNETDTTQWIEALSVSGVERDDSISTTPGSKDKSAFSRRSVFSAVRRLSTSKSFDAHTAHTS
jgi:hypothetical protein